MILPSKLDAKWLTEVVASNFLVFSSTNSQLWNYITFWDYSNITVILGFGLSQKHDSSQFFFLNYPWNWSATDQRPQVSLELTVPLSSTCRPQESAQEEAANDREHTARPLTTAARYPAAIQEVLKVLVLKSTFFSFGTIYQKRTTVCIPEK